MKRLLLTLPLLAACTPGRALDRYTGAIWAPAVVFIAVGVLVALAVIAAVVSG